MARVLIDPCIFSEVWFGDRLKDLVASKRVRFVFVNTDKGRREVEALGRALELRSLMADLGRLDCPDAARSQVLQREVEKNIDFQSCKACDDPHIFATVYLMPTKYVFSTDKRMADCRSKMVGKLSSRHLGFIVVASELVFLAHRASILR